MPSHPDRVRRNYCDHRWLYTAKDREQCKDCNLSRPVKSGGLRSLDTEENREFWNNLRMTSYNANELPKLIDFGGPSSEAFTPEAAKDAADEIERQLAKPSVLFSRFKEAAWPTDTRKTGPGSEPPSD